MKTFLILLFLAQLLLLMWLYCLFQDKNNESSWLRKENDKLKRELIKCNSDTTHKWCIRMK